MITEWGLFSLKLYLDVCFDDKRKALDRKNQIDPHSGQWRAYVK